jgi:hypothetical protein
MAKLVNRAKMTTATTGTGTITLGSAESGYQTFASAGVADADVIRYVIEDGSAWEIGEGTYTASGTTLSRTPSASSIGGGAITLSGAAVVYVTAVAEDIAQPERIDIYTTPGTTTWTKPVGAKSVEVILVGGGGGGGGGGKRPDGQAHSGGGGGAGAGRTFATMPASSLPDTVSLEVGAGGTGGAGATGNDTTAQRGRSRRPAPLTP